MAHAHRLGQQRKKYKKKWKKQKSTKNEKPKTNMASNQSIVIKTESTRTGMENEDEAMWSPKSPNPTVGVIVISDEPSMEEAEDGWTSPAISESQVGSPPESPEYTGIITDETLVEADQTKINWKGNMNLTALNEVKSFSNESFDPIALRSITCVVKTIMETADGFKIHEIRPRHNIWFQKKFHIISGPIGVVLECKISRITNTRQEKRSTQKSMIHITEIKSAITEFGEEIPELSNNQFYVVAQTHAKSQSLQAIESRRAKLYLKPKAVHESLYNQVTVFDDSIARFWPQNHRQELPLARAKILQILHKRNGKETNQATTSTTDQAVNRFNNPRRTFQS